MERIQAFAPLQLSSTEQQYFNELFSAADTEQNGRIEGKSAVEFFRRSGLPMSILREVWNMTTPNGEYFLDKPRFFVALRLISQSQASLPLSLEKIHSKNLAPPKFEGIQLPQGEMQFDEAATMRMRQGFQQLSGEARVLNAAQARELLMRTQTDIEQLKKIWVLVDPNSTGMMNEDQFVAAMHLINVIKSKGIDVPNELPNPLKQLVQSKENPRNDTIPQVHTPTTPESSITPTPRPLDIPVETPIEKPKPIVEPKPEPREHVPIKPPKRPDPVEEKKFNQSPARTSSIRSDVGQNTIDSIKFMIESDSRELQLFVDKNSMLESFIKELERKSEEFNTKISDFRGKTDGAASKYTEEIESLNRQLLENKKTLEEERTRSKNILSSNQKLQGEITQLKDHHEKEIKELQDQLKSLQSKPPAQPTPAAKPPQADPMSMVFNQPGGMMGFNQPSNPMGFAQPGESTVPSQSVNPMGFNRPAESTVPTQPPNPMAFSQPTEPSVPSQPANPMGFANAPSQPPNPMSFANAPNQPPNPMSFANNPSQPPNPMGFGNVPSQPSNPMEFNKPPESTIPSQPKAPPPQPPAQHAPEAQKAHNPFDTDVPEPKGNVFDFGKQQMNFNANPDPSDPFASISADPPRPDGKAKQMFSSSSSSEAKQPSQPPSQQPGFNFDPPKSEEPKKEEQFGFDFKPEGIAFDTNFDAFDFSKAAIPNMNSDVFKFEPSGQQKNPHDFGDFK